MKPLEVHPATRRESSAKVYISSEIFPGRARTRGTKREANVLKDIRISSQTRGLFAKWRKSEENAKMAREEREYYDFVHARIFLLLMPAITCSWAKERFKMLNSLFVARARDSSCEMKNIHLLRALTSKLRMTSLLSSPKSGYDFASPLLACDTTW